MIKECVFLGLPFEYKDICKIYPPTVGNMIGNPKAKLYQGLLTITQEDIEDQLYGVNGATEKDTIPTPFEYLLIQAYQSEDNQQLIKDAFQFFTRSDISFLFEKKQIIIGDLKELVANLKTLDDLEKLPMLTEENYFDFQNHIRAALGDKMLEDYRRDKDPRVRRIKAKARYRDKIKAKKNKGNSIELSMIAICCMNVGISPLNIEKLSYGAMGRIMAVYQGKEKYDIDIQSLLAGADKKKVKPKYWIKEPDD